MTTTNTLFSAGQGVAVPTGFLGAAKIATIAGIATGSMPASGTVVNIGTLSLTPGFYIIYGQVGFTSGATTAGVTDLYFTASINTTSATEAASNVIAGTFVAASTASRTLTLVTYVNNTSTNTFYLVSRHGATTIGGAVYQSSASAFGSQLWAIQLS
jgi:hypothetical protein